jgi:hypothetical protein
VPIALSTKLKSGVRFCLNEGTIEGIKIKSDISA